MQHLRNQEETRGPHNWKGTDSQHNRREEEGLGMAGGRIRARNGFIRDLSSCLTCCVCRLIPGR